MKLSDNIKNFDFILFFTVIIIAFLGIVNLLGSLSLNHHELLNSYVMKQIIWFGISFFVMFAIISIDYNTLIDIAYYIYGIVLILIIIVLIKGKISHGASRWISLGLFTIQPSELMKIALILALAKYFTNAKKKYYKLTDLMIPFLIIIIPVLLIAKEPDLGTSLIVFFCRMHYCLSCRHQKSFNGDSLIFCHGCIACYMGTSQNLSEEQNSYIFASGESILRRGL